MKNSRFYLFLRLIIVVFFTITFLYSYPQKVKSFYIDKDGERTGKSRAEYKRTVQKENSLWLVKDYYLNGSIQMLGRYEDKDLTQKTDTFNYYYLNGKLSGKYFYLENKKEGEQKEFFITGKVSGVSSYSNGEETGRWKWFEKDGSVKFKLDNPSEEIFDQYFQSARFPGGKRKFQEYLTKLKFPKDSHMNKSYGLTMTSFAINEDGSVRDIDVIVHGTSQMDSAVINHLDTMPNWNPGILYGEPTLKRYVIPIQFRYENVKKVTIEDETLAKAFFQSGLQDYTNEEFEEALFKFMQAIRYSNMNAKYYNSIAYCYYAMDEKDFACEYWKITDLLDPSLVKDDVKRMCEM